MQKVIHNTTAKICEDIAQQPPEELTEPQPIRRCARLLAITAVGALLVAAVVVMAVRIPKIQSERKTLPSDDPADDQLNKLLLDAQDQRHGINCPCQKQVISWCNVTTFHLYTAVKGASAPDESRTVELNDNEGGKYIKGLCHQANDEKEEICTQILGSVLNNKDSRTYLPTASIFSNPGQLYEEIAARMDTNAVEQSNVYSLLNITNHTNSLNYADSLVHIVRDMQSQFLKNSSSSSQDYWNASNETRVKHNQPYSLGMSVIWEKYLKACKPAFCDIQYPLSVFNRVIRAMAQVGGITTVITLALKFLIWPSLRVALRFPTSKSPASNG